MGAIRRHKLLLQTFEPNLATGDWIAMDVRYDETSERAVTGSVVAGDTVVLEVLTNDVKGIDKSFLDSLTAEDIVVFGTYTADFAATIPSGYTYIRARKSAGTTSTVKVQGMI